MSFSDAIRTCLAKYVTFSGRAPRPEYWFFFLFICLLSAIAGMIDWQFFTAVVTSQTETGTLVMTRSSQPAQTVVSLAVFLPHLAVAWRRMHDSGRSGWYALLPMILIGASLAVLTFGIGLADQFSGGRMDQVLTGATLIILIPTMLVLLISPLLVLWWLTRPSQPGPNDYGPNPYEVTS